MYTVYIIDCLMVRFSSTKPEMIRSFPDYKSLQDYCRGLEFPHYVTYRGANGKEYRMQVLHS